MASSYIEMFEDEFYPPVFLSLGKEVIERFNEEEEKITLEIKSYLSQYLDDLCKLQEVGLAGTAAEITFSLLYTSLEEKNIEFRIDSYEEGGFLYSDSLLTERFRAPWLAGSIDKLREELEERAVQESLRRYIRPAELEKLKLRALRSLLYYFSSRFRYVMADALDRKRLAAVKKEETFFISMGEYLDWKKIIFGVLPEVDIFNCEANTAFSFRRFSAIFYQKKTFQGLAICNARFTDCTFQDCTIDGGQMNDCIFDGCTFKDVMITNTEMVGCLFLSCSLQEIRFEKVIFYGDQVKQKEEYYEPAEFLDCAITDCRIEKSDLSKCGVKNCDIQDLYISQSRAEDSGFIGDDRVIWPDEEEKLQ